MKYSFNSHYVVREISGLGRYARQVLAAIETDSLIIRNGLRPSLYDGGWWGAKSVRHLSLLALEFFGPIFLFLRHRTFAHISPAFTVGGDFWRSKSVTVVHDLAFYRYPSCYSSKELIYFKLNLLLLKYFSRCRVVVPSKFVEDDLVQRVGICRSRISIIPPYSQFDDLIDVVNSKAPRKKQFLLLSNAHPRKNIQATVSAFLSSNAADAGYRLVIVGTFELPVSFSDSCIEVLGPVSDSALRQLLVESEALLLFSLSEGFGYPVVEAASFHTPTIHSEVTSLAEMVDPSRQPVSSCGADKIKEKIDSYLSCAEYRAELQRDVAFVRRTFSRPRFEADWRRLIR